MEFHNSICIHLCRVLCVVWYIERILNPIFESFQKVQLTGIGSIPRFSIGLKYLYMIINFNFH